MVFHLTLAKNSNEVYGSWENKDLQYCMSVKKDGSNDEYAHGIYVNENNEIFVLNATDIQFNYSNMSFFL